MTMALLRMGSITNLLTNTKRIAFTVNHPLIDVQHTQLMALYPKRINGFHITSIQRYPDAPTIPLPTNVSEIFASETGRFTPERARDIAAPVLLYGRSEGGATFGNGTKKSFNQINLLTNVDSHVDSYDCFGAISLNGTMQSNVPKPFCSSGKSMHLNMPGGQWARDGKYIAEDMQKSHYRSSVKLQSSLKNMGLSGTPMLSVHQLQRNAYMRYSTNADEPVKEGLLKQKIKRIYNTKKLQKAVKEYGTSIFVLHITISIIFLGGCYTAVISGVNVKPFVEVFADSGSERMQTVLHNSTNFVLAYAIHKLLLPVRVFITLSLSPVLVKYFRKLRISKSPNT